MAGRGNQVTVITRTPFPKRQQRVTDDGGHRQVPDRSPDHQRPPWLLGPRGLCPDGGGRDAGVARRRTPLLLHLTDAYGAVRSARVNPRPVVLSMHGTPDRAWWEATHPAPIAGSWRRWHGHPLVTVLTEVSAQIMREQYQFDPIVLTPGIHTSDYASPRDTGGPKTMSVPPPSTTVARESMTS